MSFAKVTASDAHGTILVNKKFDFDDDAKKFFEELFNEEHKKGVDYRLHRYASKDTYCKFDSGYTIKLEHNFD